MEFSTALIERAARLYAARYGRDAAVRASVLAVEMALQGRSDASLAWMRISDAIEANRLQRWGPPR